MTPLAMLLVGTLGPSPDGTPTRGTSERHRVRRVALPASNRSARSPSRHPVVGCTPSWLGRPPDRAADKQRVLASIGGESPSLTDAGAVSAEELMVRHAARAVRSAPVGDDEVAACSRSMGYGDVAAFVSALARDDLDRRFGPNGAVEGTDGESVG